jgi:hypothetical protein
MVLCRKLIEGNVFVSEEVSGIFEYVWLDSVEDGYEQVIHEGSAICGIDAFWKRADRSYTFARYEMSVLLIGIVGPVFANWNNLTSNEKECVARHILAPYGLRVPAVFSDQDDTVNTDSLLDKTLIDRQNTIEKMRRSVFVQKVRTGQMTLASSQAFAKDTKALFDLYILSNDPSFKQWLTNAVGSPYENDGFEQKAYWTQELEDELVYIYDNY